MGEKTGARVARIAAKVLTIKIEGPEPDIILVRDGHKIRVGWSEIRALAASALTQAPNRPRVKPKRKARP